jgi:hypothetical protein
LLLDFVPQFIATAGDGQLDVFAHALLKVVGVLAETNFELLLDFCAKIGFQPLASARIFGAQRGFTMVKALPDLLLQAGSDAMAKLLLSLSQRGVLFVLQTVNLQRFQRFIARFHLLGDLLLEHANAAVKALVLFELKPLLRHVESMFVLLLELLPKVVLNAFLLFLHAAVGFNLVPLPEHGHFPLKAHEMLIAKPAFLSGDGFSAFLGQFRFHRFAHFTLNLLKGALTLEFVACREVALLSEDALSKFLVANAAFASNVTTEALFLAVSGTHVPFLFRAGAVCSGELSTQG